MRQKKKKKENKKKKMLLQTQKFICVCVSLPFNHSPVGF